MNIAPTIISVFSEDTGKSGVVRLILENEGYTGSNFGSFLTNDTEIYNRTGSPTYLRNSPEAQSIIIGISLDDRFMVAATLDKIALF